MGRHVQLSSIVGGAAWFLGSLLITGCGGKAKATGDQVGTPNVTLTIVPAQATLAPAQSQQFTASSPWGSAAQWSVLQSSGGTITAAGLYTAPLAGGTYTVVAMWNGDVRYTATAQVTVLPAPPPALISPNLTAASGVQQGYGPLRNAAVAGEPFSPGWSAATGGAVRNRSGFAPPTR